MNNHKILRNKVNRFEELRRDKGYRQKDIAKVLNVLENRYSKWESGIDDISLEKVNELANYYNVSLDYLLGVSKVNIKTENNNIDFNLLCERLLKLRRDKNLSQSELGNKIGFAQTTYSGYESGNSIPTTFKLFCISIFYNVSFDYLVGRTNNKEIIEKR